MGEVYLAFDTSLRRQVAIKLLPAAFTENKARLSRFEREAYAASSLNHPNILTIYEIGQQDGSHFIATEYIEGQSVRQRMAASRMELREVLALRAKSLTRFQQPTTLGSCTVTSSPRTSWYDATVM
jgi:serine/threonine protein kinase